MFQSPAFKVFDFLFGIPLIHDIMFGVYRKQIVEKAGKKNPSMLILQFAFLVARCSLLSAACIAFDDMVGIESGW